VVLKFPALQDIAAAQGPLLVSLHRDLGGDYAYSLPYLRQGHLYGIRNEGRWNVAVLADAPLENLRNSVITTHSRGQNVLFSDGHVRLVGTRWRPGAKNDDLFQNDLGQVRAGVHADDFVLAPSQVSPLPVLDEDGAAATVAQ
jgi:prepilin-type processing-associated H-X9-DG protein